MISEEIVDIDTVRNNPTHHWNLYWLSCNPKLTVKDIDTLVLPNSRGNWEWFDISCKIGIINVINNPTKPWSKIGLSQNKQLTVELIETLKLPNDTEEWDWYDISVNINIWEVINNPDKCWIRNALVKNRRCNNKILEFFDAGLLRHLQKNIPKFRYGTDIDIKCE